MLAIISVVNYILQKIFKIKMLKYSFLEKWPCIILKSRYGQKNLQSFVFYDFCFSEILYLSGRDLGNIDINIWYFNVLTLTSIKCSDDFPN